MQMFAYPYNAFEVYPHNVFELFVNMSENSYILLLGRIYSWNLRSMIAEAS